MPVNALVTKVTKVGGQLVSVEPGSLRLTWADTAPELICAGLEVASGRSSDAR